MRRNGALRVAVVVLGDLGRSPRMQYHARALAAEGINVDLVGETGTPVLSDLRHHRGVTCHTISAPARRNARTRAGFLISAAWRTARQSIQLFWVLAVKLKRPTILLVQTPPAIPTLFLAAVAARLRRAKLIIDWHNFGYAMLALRLGPQHRLVRFSRWYEQRLARSAAAHLCVSRAMRERLRAEWGIDASLLYDEPAEQFTRTPSHMRADLLSRILAAVGFVPFDWTATRRPAVIVTSTSWTADEDFDLLLEAAIRADRLLSKSASHVATVPDLFIVITGDGPLRAAFEARIRSLALRRVHLHTVWLETDDYARLLGSADLGVCLHRSASGVDLPMKVADMFGAGLPVCALNYGPCLAERINHGHNGLLFSAADELVAQWMELFRGFPQPSPLLERLHRGVSTSSSLRWSANWKEQAARVFVAP